MFACLYRPPAPGVAGVSDHASTRGSPGGPGSSSNTGSLAARGASPAAFGRRCIPPGGVAPPSNIPDILTRRALPGGRLAALGATTNFGDTTLDACEALARDFSPRYQCHRDDLVSIDISGLGRLFRY